MRYLSIEHSHENKDLRNLLEFEGGSLGRGAGRGANINAQSQFRGVERRCNRSHLSLSDGVLCTQRDFYQLSPVQAVLNRRRDLPAERIPPQY